MVKEIYSSRGGWEHFVFKINAASRHKKVYLKKKSLVLIFLAGLLAGILALLFVGITLDKSEDEVLLGPGFLSMEWGVINGVDESWQHVDLGYYYQNPVIVATYEYPNNPPSPTTDNPAVVRITNVDNTGFDIRIQGSMGTSSIGNVYYLVVEEGSWQLPAPDGRNIEAYTYTSTVTDHDGSWAGENRGYIQSYVNPVVLGQVMSYNDVRWSAFWSSDGTQINPASSLALYTGKHVGEDPDTNRLSETIGYIVIESGDGEIDGVNIRAELGGDSVSGVGNSPPFSYSFGTAFTNTPEVGVVTQTGMDGVNGGWAVLFGTPSMSATEIYLAIDEDTIGDSERSHTAEQAGYFVFETSGGYTENEPPSTPTDILCEGIGGKGSCDILSDAGIYVQATGAVDPEGDNVTYFIEAFIQGIFSSLDKEPGTISYVALDGLDSIGETGSASFSDFTSQSISFSGVYSNPPIVVAVPASENVLDDNSMIPRITEITTTGFNLALCKDDGTSDCASNLGGTEEVHYFVFDSDKALDHDWIEVGTVNASTDGTDTIVNFASPFSNAPYVFSSFQTDGDGGTTIAPTIWSDTPTVSDVELLGCAHPGTGDTCTSIGIETAGYVAIDPVVASTIISGLQTGTADISNSLWTPAVFNPSYVNPRVMVMQNDDDGGQDPQYPWARNVLPAGFDFRYCEQDAAGVCHSHTSEFVRWIALENGAIDVDAGNDFDDIKPWTSYNDVFTDDLVISEITVYVDVISYDDSGSQSQGANPLDLELEMRNDLLGFTSLGTFGISDSGTYSLVTTDSSIINAWQSSSNTDLRIRAVGVDYFDSLNFDQIEFDRIEVEINGQGWSSIGSHQEEDHFEWDTSLFPEQINVDLRARARDIGSLADSDYLMKDANLEIDHTTNFGPLVYFVDPILDQDVIEGGTNDVLFSVLVSDYNGHSDISAVVAEFSRFDEATRAGSCIAGDVLGLRNRSFDCSVGIEYWDGSGDWDVNVTATDSILQDVNSNPAYFFLRELVALEILPGSLSWPALDPGTEDVLALNSITVNNRGNKKNASLGIAGFDLIGSEPGSILASGFSVYTANQCDLGNFLINDTQIVISGATLPAGDNSISEGQEILYFCLEDVPDELIGQTYSSPSPWSIIMFAAPFFVRRKRKVEALFSEMKEDYEADLYKFLTELRKEKKRKDNKNLVIPISIFREGLSPAEAVCKYMKENLEMRYSDISAIIGRDERTIWINYRNAKAKMKPTFKIHDSKGIPAKIFEDRKLSVLEAIVYYYRQMGKSNGEISEMIGKSISNVWTLYKRALGKNE